MFGEVNPEPDVFRGLRSFVEKLFDIQNLSKQLQKTQTRDTDQQTVFDFPVRTEKVNVVGRVLCDWRTAARGSSN